MILAASTTPAAVARMRARLCPGAIVALWAWRAALALVVAAPAAALARRAFPSPPEGDAVLWDPGAHALLAFVTREAHGLDALALEAAVVLALGTLVGVVPVSLTMVAIARRERASQSRPPRTVAMAIARLPALARLAFGVAAAQAALVGAAYFLGHVAMAVSSGALGEAYAQILGGAAAAAVLPAVAALGLAHDMARASVVRFRSGALQAFVEGVRACRRAPWSLVWAWTWRAGAGCLPILAAAAFAERAGVAGLLPLVAVASAHQAAVVLRIAFHVSWLAKTLRSAAA